MFKQLKDAAFVMDSYVKGPVKAVVISFHGLNFTTERKWPELDELELAANGALCIFPYCGPWAWMNRQTRALVNEIVRRTYEEYGLADEVPLILRGNSMGGHAALNYARYAKKVPVAVACNCPAIDVAYHYEERTDLPRTFNLAYGNDGIGLEQAFIENSPLEQADKMPRVPYFIVQGTEDQSVNKQIHGDRFVKRMKELGHEIEYAQVEGMGHCTFTDFEVYRRYQDFVLRFIG